MGGGGGKGRAGGREREGWMDGDRGREDERRMEGGGRDGGTASTSRL